jgi:hypothetical protein
MIAASDRKVEPAILGGESSDKDRTDANSNPSSFPETRVLKLHFTTLKHYTRLPTGPSATAVCTRIPVDLDNLNTSYECDQAKI